MSDKDNVPRPQPEIGQMLQQARREQGLSLHQIEDATKIRARYLADLEREDFDVLPAVYVQGSLKTYANFLGLDGGFLVRELKRRQETSPEEPPALPGGATATGTVEPPRGDGPPVRTEVVRPYLVPAALLTLVLAGVFLVAALAGEPRRPTISQVRKPTLSASTPRVYRAAGEEVAPHPSRRESSDRSEDAGEQPGVRAEPEDKGQTDADGREAEKKAEQDRIGTDPDQPQGSPGAPAALSASASAKPSPEPRPEGGRGSGASAAPEPSPGTGPAPVRGDRDGMTSPRVAPGKRAGGGAGEILVEAGGLRISVRSPRSSGGPADIQERGG